MLETEYSIDDIFDGEIYFFFHNGLSERLKKDAQAKSEKAKHAYGLIVKPLVVTEQNTATALYYRKVPLPW